MEPWIARGRRGKEKTMTYDFSEEEVVTLTEALKDYLAELRAEISRTEKHEWLVALRHEERLLNGVMDKLGCTLVETV
jgi:hypothetical protein